MEEKGLGKPKITLQFEMSQSGLTELIKAEAVVEEKYIVQEEVEVDDDEADTDTKNSTEGGEEASENATERKTEETTEEEAKKEGEADEAEKPKKKTTIVEKVRIRCH